MRSLRQLVPVIGAVIALSGCAPAAPPVNTAAEETALKAVTVAWLDAYNAGNVEKIVPMYAEDGVLMPPHAPVARGREAIRAYLTADTAGAKAAGVKLVPGQATAGIAGDTGWESGSVHHRRRARARLSTAAATCLCRARQTASGSTSGTRTTRTGRCHPRIPPPPLPGSERERTRRSARQPHRRRGRRPAPPPAEPAVAPAQPPAVNAPSGTQVVFLGTGTPLPDPDRSGPATAIVVNERAYLFDAGAGVVRRASLAARKGIAALNSVNLKTAFLTHPPLRSHDGVARPHADAVDDGSNRAARVVRTAWGRARWRTESRRPGRSTSTAGCTICSRPRRAAGRSTSTKFRAARSIATSA